MPLGETRRNADVGKTSEVGKQSGVEKKSETSDQRLWRNTRFWYDLTKVKAVGTGLLLAMAGMSGALADQSRSLQTLAGSDHATGLLPASNQQGQFIGYHPLEGYVPSAKDREQYRAFLEKMNHPPFYFNPPKDPQATPSGETSQSTMETQHGEQDKNKGKDPLSSKREKIDALQSLMDKLKEHPEARSRFEKMLNERAVRGRSLRTLPSDKMSACADPCSDIPASVDCIKECTTPNVFGFKNVHECLDVSTSGVSARIEPSDQVPGQQVHFDYNLRVQNNCPQAVNDISYRVDISSVCPSGTDGSTVDLAYGFSADLSSVAPGNFAGVKAGQDMSSIWRCTTPDQSTGEDKSYSLPSELSVIVSASGMDATIDSEVYSRGEKFIVLGTSVDGGVAPCDQKCSPAMDTPSIVFVHGYRPSLKRDNSDGHDCENYWGDAMKFLRERGLEDLRTIQYYDGDKNCQNGDEKRYSSNLHHPLYNSLCTNYRPGPEGTNDESIYHLSCLFAQYLNYNFGRANREVILVGHSMGGLIMRETLYQMQENAGQGPFPPTIGHVTKAITFNTPHSGTYFGNLPAYTCGGCTQGNELSSSSDLIKELSTNGRNPQSSEGFTEWTTIGSQCDIAVQPAESSVGMYPSHAVVYSGPIGVTPTCYDHGGALHDNKTEHDAKYSYCDTRDPGRDTCTDQYTTSARWRDTKEGLHGLELLYRRITNSAIRTRPRLWMAATLASTWALLARQRI